MTEFDRTATGYESSRNFVSWFFTKSHPRLLLWSEKGNTEKTRIEVLFTNVIASVLQVAEADRDFEAPSDLLEPFWSSPFPRAPGDTAGR